MFPFPSPLLLGPASAGGGGTMWSAVMGPLTITSNNGNWQGYTLRNRIPANALTDIAATLLRYTLKDNGQGINVIAMYHGLAGVGTFDFASAPTQVLFGGSASGSCGANSTLLSDGAAISYDGTADVLVAVAFNVAGTTGFHTYGLASGQTAYKLGNDASSTTASGYTTYTGTVSNFFDQVEGWV